MAQSRLMNLLVPCLLLLTAFQGMDAAPRRLKQADGLPNIPNLDTLLSQLQTLFPGLDLQSLVNMIESGQFGGAATTTPTPTPTPTAAAATNPPPSPTPPADDPAQASSPPPVTQPPPAPVTSTPPAPADDPPATPPSTAATVPPPISSSDAVPPPVVAASSPPTTSVPPASSTSTPPTATPPTATPPTATPPAQANVLEQATTPPSGSAAAPPTTPPTSAVQTQSVDDPRDKPCASGGRTASGSAYTCASFDGYYCSASQNGQSGTSTCGGTWRCESMSNEPSVNGMLAAYPASGGIYGYCHSSDDCTADQFCDKSPQRNWSGDVSYGNCVDYLKQGCKG